VGDHITNCDPTTAGGGCTCDLSREADQARSDGFPDEGASHKDLSSVVCFIAVQEELGVQHVSLLAVHIGYWSGGWGGDPLDSAVIGNGDWHNHFDFHLVDDVAFRDVGVVVIVRRFRSGEVQASRGGGSD